jgi:hypothetical protein
MAGNGYSALISTDQVNGGLTFQTGPSPNTTADAAVYVPERMRITGGGYVGINTYPSYQLEVNGNAAKPGTANWIVTSDARLKKDVTPYSDGLSSLLKINPIRFHYNEQSGYDTKPEYVGVIAQELKEIAPYMVGTFEKNGAEYLNVDNSAMIYMLINAMKEQQKIIEDLKLTVDVLKKQTDDLKGADRIVSTK